MYNTHFSRSQIFVLDQDEALDFYINMLGLEVAADVDLGFMRWLTVRVPGDHSARSCSSVPGPPVMDEATAAQVRDLVTKGAMGGALFLTTDDAHSTFETLKDRGVDVTDEPDDAALRHRLRYPRSRSATRSASARCSKEYGNERACYALGGYKLAEDAGWLHVEVVAAPACNDL